MYTVIYVGALALFDYAHYYTERVGKLEMDVPGGTFTDFSRHIVVPVGQFGVLSVRVEILEAGVSHSGFFMI